MRKRVDVPLSPVVEAEAEKGGDGGRGGGRASRKGGRGRCGAVVVMEAAAELGFKAWLSRAFRSW